MLWYLVVRIYLMSIRSFTCIYSMFCYVSIYQLQVAFTQSNQIRYFSIEILKLSDIYALPSKILYGSWMKYIIIFPIHCTHHISTVAPLWELDRVDRVWSSCVPELNINFQDIIKIDQSNKSKSVTHQPLYNVI